MKKIWIIMYVVLFILIVLALHLEKIAFIALVIGNIIDIWKDKKDNEDDLRKKVEKRQETIDILNHKIDEYLKNQEELLNFKGKFNDLYKKEVLGDSKS